MKVMIRTEKLTKYYGKGGEIKAQTKTKTLEQAFITITGGVEEK
jgi:hypothetical protein